MHPLLRYSNMYLNFILPCHEYNFLWIEHIDLDLGDVASLVITFLFTSHIDIGISHLYFSGFLKE